MTRAVVIDAPELTSDVAAGAFLASLGVDVSRLRVDLFRDATILGTRIRIIDDAGDVAPYLPEVAENGLILVLRPGQLAARAAEVPGAASLENVAGV